MAIKAKPKPVLVTCGTCRHFQRDTEGPNRNADTGIFFMGISDIGCDPVTHTYLVSYDSGVFICPPANENVMTAETYQVVSKMYTNQRVTRGKSEEGTKIYKEAMTDEVRRAFAVLTTIKEM